MTAKTLRHEEGEEQWKYTIYLVAFPGVVGHSDIGKTTFHVSEMIRHLVPEARVLPYPVPGGETAARLQDTDTDDEQDPAPGKRAPEAVNASQISIPGGTTSTGAHGEDGNHTGTDSVELTVGDSEDAVSVASMVWDPFWSASIEKEALALLDFIRSITPGGEDADRSSILLAGYGFGGIVVKQAIILANTTPKYYDIAYNVSRLVFFSTPHRADEKRGWEGVLLDLIQAQGAKFPGRLSQVLSALVNSVSQLSHGFHKFAAKYPIVNFIEDRETPTVEPVIGELGKFNNDFEVVVTWRQKNFKTIMYCDVDRLDLLESLRTHLAPARLWTHDVFHHLGQATQAQIKNTYFEALQALSKSHWVLHETRTLERYEDFITLKDIYGSLLSDIASTRVRDTASIQVIGPAGYGKSALLKLIVQDISQKSSVIILESYLAPSEEAPTLYGLLASFLHQIISQRPSLFYAVRNMVAEILLRDTWTEQSLRTVLAALLHRSERVEFLIVICDYDRWSREICCWWSGELRPLLQSCGTKFTFVTSSGSRIENLACSKPHELDLKKEYAKYRKRLVRAKLNNLLDRGYGSVTFGHGPTASLRKMITAEAESFQGSFTAIDAYLTLLFKSFPLTTAEAIEGRIEASPKTERELYELEISALRAKHVDVFYWIAWAISWMMLSARPLRLEELAAATAVNLDDSILRDIQDRVSMDVSEDLKRHLGPIFAVESRHGRIASSVARDILATAPRKHLDLQDDYRLTKLCLHYLELVLTKTHYEAENDAPDVKGIQAETAVKDEKAYGKDMRSDSKRPNTTPRATQQDRWAKCLSYVSWKHQSHNYREPALEFLDYACRFWPAHFLRIKSPEQSLKDDVANFLQAPHGQRWFQIYLLCHGQSANPLGTDEEVERTAVGITEFESVETRKPSAAGNENQPHPEEPDTLGARRQSAGRMACYIGLTPIIPELLGPSISAKDCVMLDARRGCSERVISFLDTASPYYLSCAISNDNADLTKSLLEHGGPTMAKCYPLHKAALGGSLKTSMMLFRWLDDPAETNEDGKTPLHMAAAGGSTSTILLLLGRDAFEHEPRDTEASNMLDKQDNKLQTPLIIAASMGHVEATMLLLQCGADVSIQDDTGKTALHYAVILCPAVVEDLASPNLAHVLDNDGCTALHIAARSGNARTTSAIVAALHKVSRFEGAVNYRDKADKTPLQYAAQSGYTVIVEDFLRYGVLVEEGNNRLAAELAAARGHLATVRLFMCGTNDSIGSQLLVAASGAGQLLVVHYLLYEKRISPGVEWEGRRPLCQASARGYMEVVRALLRSRASVSAADGQRKTPLHHAAENGMYTVAKTLLDRQANVNAPDVDRKTPLHSAAREGKVNIIELFLEHKANIEACSRTRETPLHLAIRYPEAVGALLGASAEPNAADSLGQTPLHMAARCKCPQSVRYLLDKKADIHAPDDNGRSPLYYAIKEDDLPTVQELCKNNEDWANSPKEISWAVDLAAFTVFEYLLGLPRRTADDSYISESGLLHDAAAGASVKILDLVLRSGVDVNVQRQGSRALHVAAENGRVENIQKLLEHKAEVDARDDSEKTPLHSAAFAGQAEAVKALLDAGSEINAQGNDLRTPVYIAAFYGRIKSLETLLQYKPDLSIVDAWGWTPFHAGVDNLEVTTLLVGGGANPNLPKSDQWTPLHLAASWGNPSIVEFLLQNGGDPTLTTEDGNTALHLAVGEHSVGMVGAMLKHGAEKCINERGEPEDTALHFALECSECNVEMTRLLIEHGADVDLRTSEELSTLVLAVDARDLEKLRLLLSTEVTSRKDPKWQLDDLVPAYWRAIALHCQGVAENQDMRNSEYPDIIEALVEKEPKLRDAESAGEGLNALEMCLSKRSKGGEEEPLALRLVELGINPLSRHHSDRTSALEFGVLSRRSAKADFLNLCADRIPTNAADAAALGLGFRELRIATELDQPDMWRKLEPLKDQVGVGGMTDADGWSLDHFAYQTAGRIPAPAGVSPLISCKTPQGLVFPSQWAFDGQELGERFQIEDDRLGVVFPVNLEDRNNIVALRADFPFPPRPINPGDEIQYFEAKISSADPKWEIDSQESEPRPLPIIVIGFCGEFADMTNAHIGWNVWTVGYHGDDGIVFESNDNGDYDTRHKFGPGNTVGCGIDYSKEEYFFTRDGEVVARHKSKVIFRKLYPAISHDRGPCKVKVNFDCSKCVWQRPTRKLTRTSTWSRRD